MTYSIELNIADITVGLANTLRNIGENNGFKVFNHGYDRLVFESDLGRDFTKLINELNNCCEVYGISYIDLLDLY